MAPPPAPSHILPAAQLKAHPAFQRLEWDLPASREGRCQVAAGRGGPFELWYEVHGVLEGGVKLVWIMGLGAFRTAWKRQTRYFGHTEPNKSKYSSLIFDNRGMGLSDKPLLRYSTSEMARDVVDLLDHLGWKEERSLFVVGVSMGGMIAQELGLLIPERIAGLGLISTAPRVVRTIPYLQHLRARVNMFVPRDIDVQLSEIGRNLFSDAFLAGADVDGEWPTNGDRVAAGELAKRLDTEHFTRKGFVLQAVAAGWHAKSARELGLLGDRVGRERVLVMHGTEDRMLGFVHGEMLRVELGLVEGRGWRVWEGKGHVLMWECGEEFNKVIEGWVEGLRGKA